MADSRSTTSRPREISCLEAVTVVQEFLDGELEDVTTADVRAHFEACSRCWPHLRFEQSFRDAVARAARGEGAPAGLKRRVAELLAAAGAAGAADSDGPEDPPRS